MKLFQFGPVVQEEMTFKRLLIYSSGSPRVHGTEPFMQFGRGHYRNILVKLFLIWTSGSWGDVV